jgi:predicted dehydrogenase
VTAPIRIGVIGAGAFGLRHIDAYVRCEDVTVVGVADVDRDCAQQAARRFGVERWFASAEDLLADCRPDGVSVVTRSSEHVDPALHALDADCSVLLEKPVATSTADVARLQQADERSVNAFVMPGHVLRFASPYLEAKRDLERGVVGKLLGLASVRDRGRNHQQRYPDDHPALLTLIHDVDLALWLSGAQPLRVTAEHRGSPAGHPPLVWANVVADDGSVWWLRTSWLLANDSSVSDRLELYGEDGALVVEVDPHARVHQDALDAEIKYFCSCIRSGRLPTTVTLEQAATGIRVAEAVIASATAAGEPVHVGP